MPVQFDTGPAVADLVRRTESLIQDVVLPIELAHRGSAHDASEDVRRELQDAARKAEVFAPHVSTAFGDTHRWSIGRRVVRRALARLDGRP